jgi:hypothetical protein
VAWGLTGLFAFLLGLFTLVKGAFPVGAPSGLGWIILPPLTVFIVALLVREGRTSAAVVGASSATKQGGSDSLTHRGESPDIDLPRAMKIVMNSTWAKDHTATTPAGLREMADKLAMHKLTAFGRRTDDARIEPIPSKMWASMEIALSEKAAVMRESREIIFRDLQFDRAYVMATWTGENSWMRL